MEQIGYVRKIIDDNTAEVEIRRISGCGGGCSSCGESCDSPSIILSMKNLIDAKEGDLVEIKAQPKNIIKYALIVYMIPFVMLVLGISLGVNWFQSLNIVNYEIYGFGVGLIFLTIALGIVKIIDGRMKNKNENTMQMVKIID